MQCSISSCPNRSEEATNCLLGKPEEDSGPASLTGSRRNDSLTLASMEIDRILAANGRTTFLARGACMHPCIRPGEALDVTPRKIEEIDIGDIAVFRRAGSLFGHRTIAKGVDPDQGRPYIITRPDSSRRYNDGPSYAEDVLGVVTAIKRRGRWMEPRVKEHPRPVRAWLSILRTMVYWRLVARRRLIDSLATIQRGALYRSAARFFFSFMRGGRSYIVRLPFLEKQACGLHHPMSTEAFDISNHEWRESAVNRWVLALHLSSAHPPAATATFMRRPPECPFAGWWVEDLRIRARYAGVGLERDLLDKAGEIFRRGGVVLQRSGA